MRILLVLALSAATLGAGAGAAPPHAPKPGDKERDAILEAVRDPVEDAVHCEVTFKVKHLMLQDDWAFLDALPLTKDGKKMSYKGTMYEEWVEDADEVLWVLLRKKRERWYIVEKVFFTTDVSWVDWPKYFRAPKGIFPKLDLE